ncbi:unnamed protein product [Heligmosomoides polygyrus]|uniref:Solute carrier organic anion transporter family member n=1 Tax=Heligmosomoides polygyrus TaxID=6339 RepID=A0A3P8BMZ0_HELPZ|nr:unnamed protein product [Heligmosomoides polygyrus]
MNAYLHKVDECKKDHSSSGPFMMIFGGLMLLGVGRTMPFSLGLPLMDDNVKKNNLPLYFACMFFVKILGPVIGLLVGSKLNEIYYTFDPPQGLTPLDPMWIEFFTTVRQLFRNPIYVGAMLGRIVDVLAFKGFFVFLGKYLEIQFGVPQYRIQKYLAGTGVVGFACGVIIGSVAMRKFRLQGRKAASWVAVCSLVAALISFANGAVGCKSVIGQIGEQAVANNFTFPTCRKDCVCDEMPFYPVCDVFYSPCQAGCPLSGANFSIYTKVCMPLIFTQCECSGTPDLAVSRDYCPTAQNVGQVFYNFRSVPPEHRSISLGFNGFLVSLLATLPSPVFWGKIFDMSCLMWQNVCNKTGACPIYDTDQLRIRLHMIYGGLRLFSLLSDIWVIYWAKGLKLVDEEDEEEKPKEDGNDQELLPLTIEDEKATSKAVQFDTSRNKEAVLED